MARIAGVDLPRDKRIEIGLTYIFGIGPTLAKEILATTGINPDTRVRNLTEEEVSKLRLLEKCFYFVLTKINAVAVDKLIQMLPISENEKNEIRKKLQDIKEAMREKEQSKTVDYKQINKSHHTNNAKYRDIEK